MRMKFNVDMEQPMKICKTAREAACRLQDECVREFVFGDRKAHGQLFESLWRERSLRPGLRVSVIDAALGEPLRFDYQKSNDFIDFGFTLEGGLENAMRSPEVGNRTLVCATGSGGMACQREAEGTVRIPAKRRIRMLHLHVAPAVLRDLFRLDLQDMQDDVQRVMEQGGHFGVVTQWRMGPMVLSAANDLFFALRSGFGSHVYLEGKALELLGLQCMGEASPPAAAGVSMSRGERDSIIAVRDALEREFASPPTLADLAAAYGMNVTKLQAGFREVFGASVFGYLKEFRLQKAKQLMDGGGMNVSEVAWRIGYTNVSHFGAAYKKRFGVLPKKYLQSKQALNVATVTETTAM